MRGQAESQLDGSPRLDDSKVGAACVWWQEEGASPVQGAGRNWKVVRAAEAKGWFDVKEIPPGDKQRGFDDEQYALCQAAKTFDKRRESNQRAVLPSRHEGWAGGDAFTGGDRNRRPE